MRKRGRFEAVPQVPEVKIRGQKPLLQMFVSSMLSLLLCCTMLFSTTLAWFSDTVISAGSQITIGELDVSMSFGGPQQRSGDAPLFGGDIKWMPNHFVVRTVTIANDGNLDIQYVLNLVLQTEAEENTTDIARYLQLYVKQVDQNEDIDQLTLEDIQQWNPVGGGTLADVFKNGISAAKGHLEAKTGETSPEITYAIALYMVKNVEDSLMGKSMKLDIKLNAYQANIDEEDMTELPDTTTKTDPEDTTKTDSEDTTKTDSEDTTKTDSEDTTKTDSEDTTKTDSEDTTTTNSEDTTTTNSEDTTTTNSEDTTTTNSEDTTTTNSEDTTTTNSEDTTTTDSEDTDDTAQS